MTDATQLSPLFRAEWPFRPRFARVNGWRMHYIDEGAGDPVVLLHGNPTWGYLYRTFVPPLVEAGHRVIVPDMVGFGLSEKPTREDAHSLDGHIANLVALLRGLELSRITLVCHDRDLWAILCWMIAGVGAPWTVEDLEATGRLYRIPAVSP